MKNTEDKYGFVYLWRDKKRNMYYIGCHWGYTNDGYICSSNRMRDAFKRRRTDFNRRILEKMSESKLGKEPWNKGKKCPQTTGDKNGAKKLKGKTWIFNTETKKREWI